jgi:ankyrin repeat protein
MFRAGVLMLAVAGASLAQLASAGNWLDETTPLHRAAWNGDMPTVVAELEKGVDPNIRDDLERTPLHLACYKGRISTTPVEDRVVGQPDPGNYYTSEMVEYMIEKGADVNALDKDGSTPLMEAIPNGHKDIVELLLKSGAKKDVENRHGETPLQVAEHRKHADIQEMLGKDEL